MDHHQFFPIEIEFNSYDDVGNGSTLSSHTESSRSVVITPNVKSTINTKIPPCYRK